MLTTKNVTTIVSRDIKMRMSEREAKSQMHILFLFRDLAVKRNGIVGIIEILKRRSKTYFLWSRTKPVSESIFSRPEFSQHSYEKDFEKFFTHLGHVPTTLE